MTDNYTLENLVELLKKLSKESAEESQESTNEYERGIRMGGSIAFGQAAKWLKDRMADTK